MGVDGQNPQRPLHWLSVHVSVWSSDAHRMEPQILLKDPHGKAAPNIDALAES